MSEGVLLRRGRRRPSAVLVVPLLSAAILALGWALLWSVARQQADAGLDRWIGAEAAHGRAWTCPDRRIHGFPFRIALSCRDVGFDGVVDGAKSEGHLAGLSAQAWLYEPSAVYVVLDGPMALHTAEGRADFSLTWARLGAKLRGIFGDQRRAEIVGEGLTLVRPNGTGGTARRLEIRGGPAVAPAASPAGAAIDADRVEVTLSGLTASAIDAVTGEAAPLDGLFSGTVTRAFGDLPDLGPATVERWRRAGGRLDVSDLSLTKGTLWLGAAGRLGLDDLHRVQGRLEARFRGFEPLAKRFGVPVGAVQLGGMLANLLGPKAAAPPPPGTVALPIVMSDGAVSIGSYDTGLRLPRLY